MVVIIKIKVKKKNRVETSAHEERNDKCKLNRKQILKEICLNEKIKSSVLEVYNLPDKFGFPNSSPYSTWYSFDIAGKVPRQSFRFHSDVNMTRSGD